MKKAKEIRNDLKLFKFWFETSPDKVRFIIYYFIGKIHYIFIRKFKLPFCSGIMGYCFNRGKRRRQNTAYYEEELNWVFLCDECAKVNDKYWQERWAEYYSMII